MLDDELPGRPDHVHDQARAATDGGTEEDSASVGSLTDDLAAIIDDGRTYVEAEMAFQKSRLAFAADRGKSGALYGVCAFAVLHLALVAMVFGAIIALTPLLTAWGATALVVALLVVSGVVLAMQARKRFSRLIEAYAETRE